MEALGILLAIASPIGVIVAWVLGVIGYVRANQALRELAKVREDLRDLERHLVALQQPRVEAEEVPPASPWAATRPAAAPEPAPPVAPLAPEPEPVEARTAPTSPPEPEPAPERPRHAPISTGAGDIEALLTQRLGVWVGAAALLLAGVFLIRYAIDRGWLGPTMRCVAAFLLGLALLAAAEWLRRHPGPVLRGALGPDQAPAALGAGGAAVLFGAAYGAGVFYALVPPAVGFGLMAVAAMAGLLAALRFGQLTAAVGVAGAYLTPGLIHAPDATLPGLFAYLLAVTAAALAIVRYTAWVWLGWAAVAGGIGWVLFAAGLDTTEAWAPATFLVLAAALNLELLPPQALTHPRGRWLAWIPFAALATAGLVLELALPEPATRATVLLLSPLAVAKALREPRLDFLPWLGALAGLLALLFWALPAWQPTGEAIRIEGATQGFIPGAWAPTELLPLLWTSLVFAAFHAACGLWRETRAPEPLRWAALPAAVPALTLATLYALVGRFQPDIAWATAALLLTAGLTATAARAMRGASPQRAGVHAAGAVAALLIGCTILLTDHWLTLAFALLLPALAWIEGLTGLRHLRPTALAIALLVLVRLLLNWHVLDYAFGLAPILNGLVAAYAVPALAFAVAAYLFRRRDDDLLVPVLESGAILLAAAFVMLEIRHALTGGRWDSPPTFTEAALHVATLCVQAVGYAEMALRTRRDVPLWASRILAALGFGGGALLLLENPAFDGERASAAALALAYLLPAVLALEFARRARRPPDFSPALRIYALIAGLAWIFLQIRALFHPGASLGLWLGVEDAEMWSWSGAGLVYGAALMAIGIRGRWRGARLAALAVIGLVTAKVFLLDMAGLAGLWRVVSFLGLGLALIGLGALYRRFEPPAGGRAPP